MFLSDRVLLLWVGASCCFAQNRRRSGRPIKAFVDPLMLDLFAARLAAPQPPIHPLEASCQNAAKAQKSTTVRGHLELPG